MVAEPLIYTRVLINTYVIWRFWYLPNCRDGHHSLFIGAHHCPTPSRNPGPTRMRMSQGWTSHGSNKQSPQSREWVTAVMNLTRMSYDGNIMMMSAIVWYQPLLQANLVYPLRAGSAYGVPLLAPNQMRGPAQRHRAQERASHPSGHRSGSSCAHIRVWVGYSGEECNR